MKKSSRGILLIAISFILVGVLTISVWVIFRTPKTGSFDGNRAYQDVITQVNFGPRVPGTPAHQVEIDWLTSQLSGLGWVTEIQTVEYQGVQIQNVIAKKGLGSPRIVFGAHYDCRQFADKDPNLGLRTLPVPGANDGASGDAVLLELARELPKDPPFQTWLVFFDWEDQGEINSHDWSLGARAFVDSLTSYPDTAIIIDMIGDIDLNIYKEQNSTPELVTAIWDTASRLGYQKYFINQSKYSIIDDHIPFLQKGIHAIDIIDINYSYWHTTGDTPDKVSPQSLGIVGNALLKWFTSIPYKR